MSPELFEATKQREHACLAEIRAARVKFGNDVWLGHAITVLAGVTAGDGAMLAAGAVLERDVARYATIGSL